MVAVNYDWDEIEDNIDEEYDDAGATIVVKDIVGEHMHVVEPCSAECVCTPLGTLRFVIPLACPFALRFYWKRAFPAVYDWSLAPKEGYEGPCTAAAIVYTCVSIDFEIGECSLGPVPAPPMPPRPRPQR